MDLSPEAERNFWELTSRSPEKDGCWEWLGPDNGNGYGMYNLNGRSVGAHRVAWCLEHKQTLPSYHQIRRKCKNRACVRPNHLRRIRRVLAKSANGKKNKPYTVIRPPSAARGDGQNISDPPTPKSAPPKGPRVERYMKETKEVKKILTAVVAGFSQVSEMLYAHKKGLENLHARLDAAERSRSSTQREQTDRLSAAVAALTKSEAKLAGIALEFQERPTPAPAPPPSLPAPAPPPPPDPLPEVPEVQDDSLGALLAQMYMGALGAEPTDHERDQLIALFGYAISEAEVARKRGTPTPASKLFAGWLESFQSVILRSPDLEPSVSEFQRLVERLVLPPALN